MATLPDLRTELAGLQAVQDLAAALANGAGEFHVGPLPVATRTPMVAALARLHAAPLLYVVPGADAALRAADDLRQWLDPAAVLLYPASDAMPYEHMSPGAEVLTRRLRVLQALSAQAQALVIVAPVKALLQPTLTPEELAGATTTLRRGQVLRQDDLVRRLLDLGYRSAPTVEEPGELVRRGDLVDIWPTADAQPLRVEFFGDEIDTMRRFDPGTQRSEGRSETVSVGPPHEIPFWRRSEALARISAIDTSGLRPEAQSEWQAAFERLEQGLRFEGRAFYGPFFRDEMLPPAAQATEVCPASVLDHLPAGSAILFSEAQFLAQHAVEIHEQAESQRQRLIDAAELPAAYPRPYLLWAEVVQHAACSMQHAEVPTTSPIAFVDLSSNAPPEEPASLVPLSPRPLVPVASVPAPHFVAAELFGGQFRRLVNEIVKRLGTGERVVAVTSQAARLQELVEERLQEEGAKPRTERAGKEDKAGSEASAFSLQPSAFLEASAFSLQPSAFTVVHGALEGGWRLPELGLTLYTDAEIFGLRQRRLLSDRRKPGRSADERSAFVRGLKHGDYVVHIEHGIAVYEGLIRRTVGEIEREYLVLRYAAGDKIYVPVDQVDRVARYVGAGDSAPSLTRLNTQEWERAKRKARAAVQDLAEDLLNLYAQRRMKQGHAFSSDNEWQRELELAFPYIETEDQLRAISEVKLDMEQPVPMDRLVCGDVGFGKTEVALRAAFKAVQDGKQVAVLVPTTVLAQQHFDTFSKRMAPFPVKVEMLSRFRTPKAQEAIIAGLAKGTVDVVIGTHRLLSKDVRFKDLGLVVVDEEQRFGVRHKERLKRLRAEVDVLTLTATPIPRTLHMAMAGIRDLSVIDTPPEDRVPIKTYVLPYNEQLMRESILREIEREGQVYVVHNRVQSIYHVANRLRTLVPEATLGVGHGQLDERELEQVMLDFFEGRFEVLVCTTIIESGLDVPNANTIIIDEATNYGLAQLYQLRGRVGRSANRAYAYLLYKQEKPMTGEAQARLEAIQEATELGAGFRVAMRDLEIRGAGNLLGAEQSGHIAAVGFDLYSRLLEQAVKQLKAGVDASRPEDWETMRLGDQETGGPGDREALDAEPSLRPDLQVALADAASKLVINEKVLVSPLVTLDLPLTAYIPSRYLPDERVRLALYQRMVGAQTVEEVRALRQELQDRFGDPPEEALHLLTWLQIKALALQAGVSSVVTTSDEFVIRLPILAVGARERLGRRFGRDKRVKIGPQFVRLDRRALGETWSEKLMDVLEVLGG